MKTKISKQGRNNYGVKYQSIWIDTYLNTDCVRIIYL